jgi:hypothetical protein
LQKFAERLITTEDITRIREEVEKQVAEVLRDFRKHATIAGYWSTIAHENIKEEPDKKSVLPLRGVPALRFTLQPAASLSKEICQTLRYEDIIKQKVSFDDLTKEDPSGYTAFVLYALAFGAAGRWHVTRTLSEHALHIAEHEAHKFLIPDGHEPVTGNEAAYLLCWSIRHSAKTTAQLLEAQWYLQQAAQRKVKATGKRDDEDDIRYKSESIALDMTYNLFKLFSGETISDNISTLAQCQERALALLKRVEQDEYEEEYIKLVVKRQALAYLFCALLLREFKNNENIADQKKKEILQWLPYFEDILEKKPQSTLTCFTLLIYLVACYRYGREEQREECKLKAKEALSWERVRRCYVMPYDEKLYDFLLKLVV